MSEELEIIKNKLDLLEEKNDSENEETSRQLKAMWLNLDNLKKTANESLILAKHADKGYIEIYTELKSLKSNFSRIEASNEKIKELSNKVPTLISNLEISLSSKLNSNVKWVISIVISFLAIIGFIIKGG